jgi:tetratricopeptide (TPR) repeat protein
VGINPEYKEAYYMRGLSFIQMKEFQKAADDFNRAVIFDPKNIDLYYQLGVVLYELKKYNESLDMLNKVTNMSKKYVAAYQEKIMVMMALDQGFNAIKVSDSALALDASAMNYYLQGMVTEKLNSKQKAEWAYSKSIKEDKKFVKGYIALASLQTDLNKLDEAMANCNQAIALDANSREALVVRSRVFLKKLDYRNAIDDISRAIILNANEPEMFFIRGTYYQDFSQHQNAINDFNKVISSKVSVVKASLSGALISLKLSLNLFSY